MEILFVYSLSCRSSSYIMQAMDCISSKEAIITKVFIGDYAKFDDRRHDFLIYNSFADESNELKFIPNIVLPADEKYHKFKGPKLLLDTHDDGTKDGFERFADKKSPRIKNVPGYSFVAEFNVPIMIPFRIRPMFCYQGEEKVIPIICCGAMEDQVYEIRRIIAEKLKVFESYVYTERAETRKYSRLLKSAKISIAMPGYGQASFAHGEALAAETVLLSYESVKAIKLLPFGELIDGYNYVSFSLDSFESSLLNLLRNKEQRAYISGNGKRLYEEGYSPRKTAEQILNFFTKGG